MGVAKADPRPAGRASGEVKREPRCNVAAGDGLPAAHISLQENAHCADLCSDSRRNAQTFAVSWSHRIAIVVWATEIAHFVEIMD